MIFKPRLKCSDAFSKILFPIILFFSLKVYAQENYTFHHIKVEDGLSQSTVACIHQDKKGLIWIGTQDGLNKYDGTKFTYYKHNPDDSTTLSAPSVLSIYEDDNGNLWLGTDGGGLNIFNTRTEKFTCYKNIPGNSNSITSNRVTAVIHETGLRYLVATFQGGLNSFDYATKKFTALGNNVAGIDTLLKHNIFRMLKSSDGMIWLASRAGLMEYNPGTKKLFCYHNDSTDENSLPDNWVQSLYEDRENRLWIGTRRGDICELNRHTNKFIRYNYGDTSAASSRSYISCFNENDKNQLWIGTGNSGIKILNKKTGLIRNLKNEKRNESSLSSDAIRCFLTDKSNMLWIGTNGGGVDLYEKAFGFFNKLGEKTNSIFLKNNVYAIYRDLNGMQWLGTNGSGLYSIDPLNETITNYKNDPLQKNSISNNAAWSICEDNNKMIWIGTIGGGISIFNKGNNTFNNFSNDPVLRAAKNTWTIYKDNDNLVWIGTADEGIFLHDLKTKKNEHFDGTSKKENALHGKGIFCITQSKTGLILIGTKNSGLNIYDKQTKSYRHFIHDDADEFSLSSNNVQCIFEAQNNLFWIGTLGGGLNLLDLNSGRCVHFTESDGLPNNVIYGILPDSKNNLWLSTNKGICRFAIENATDCFSKTGNPKPSIRNFDSKDGLPSDEFNQGAYYKDKDGTLYFGSINGIAAFNPDSIIDNKFIPPVIITRFKVFEKEYPLDTTINYKQAITLAYNQNFFSFEFAALSYLLPEKNSYAFMMENFDHDWNYSGNRHYASYTNLDPGDYTFKVKASNNDSYWNNNFASIKITINPPFWKTWWFRVLVAVAVVVVVGAIFRSRVNRIKKEEAQKTEFHKALAEVEMKALRAQMNPHFIFNSLNSINKFIVAKEEHVASDYLSRFSRLIRLVLENSMTQFITLDKELEALELYIQMEQLRFDLPFDYKIAVDENIESESILIPPLLLQPFVENALWHGLTHKETAGKISININSNSTELICTIEDDGVGRAKAAAIKAKKTSGFRSLGMQVTKERVELLKQTKNIEPKINFIDLYNNQGNATGTRAEIIIPLEYNY